MPYEDKVIRRNPPAKTLLPESPCSSQSIFLTSNMEPTGSPIQHGPVAILWDIENCLVSVDICPEDIAGNIRMALRMHPIVNGVVTLFSASGDFNAFPRRLREGCQRTGMKLVGVPNGRKDAADKAILVDMFLFALDNCPPSSIVLISGDVNFALAPYPRPTWVHCHSHRPVCGWCLFGSNQCREVCLGLAYCCSWRRVCSPHPYIPTSCNYVDGPIEEETIGYRGRSQIYCYNSVQEYEVSNVTPVPQMSSSQSKSLPCGLNEVPKQDWWVQPGDIQGLKEQLVRICEMSGGTMPLLRVPDEYIKNYGCPL